MPRELKLTSRTVRVVLVYVLDVLDVQAAQVFAKGGVPVVQAAKADAVEGARVVLDAL